MPSARSGGEVRVRLRLSVKRVDQRRWAGEANGDGGAAAAKALAAGKVRGSRVCSLGSRVALDPKAPVSARLRTVSGGRVKLLLHAQRPRSSRLPRPKRFRVEDLHHERGDDDDDDEEEVDEGTDLICTWLQCDVCGKWRIVPDHSVGADSRGRAMVTAPPRLCPPQAPPLLARHPNPASHPRLVPSPLAPSPLAAPPRSQSPPLLNTIKLLA